MQNDYIWTPIKAFAKYAVEATSIEDFLTRYYKPERYTGRGEEYAAILLASHKESLEKDGIDIISHHDSVTGNVVAYISKEKRASIIGSSLDAQRIARTLLNDLGSRDAGIKYSRSIAATTESPEMSRQYTEAAAILEERAEYPVCNTCGKQADASYRRWDASGKITEGCIDDFHTGHLITPSASAWWHYRPQAKRWRASQKKRLAELGRPRRKAVKGNVKI